MARDTQPVLLDLFCGAGGCTKGYQEAGFYVVGVDIKPQPNYCGDEFVQADALVVLALLLIGEEWNGYILADFAAIHASPPCQAYSILRNNGCHAEAPRLIAPTRVLLEQTGLPYVIENVAGAAGELHNPTMVCGGSLGLSASGMDLHRHRLFETNFPLMGLACARHNAMSIGVYGHGTNSWHREKLGRNIREAEKREAMQIDWMTREELKEAIPPAYTRHIGSYLLVHLEAGASSTTSEAA